MQKTTLILRITLLLKSRLRLLKGDQQMNQPIWNKVNFIFYKFLDKKESSFPRRTRETNSTVAEKKKRKKSDSDKLLNSIIQARCLTNEEERLVKSGSKTQTNSAVNDYVDNSTDLKSTDANRKSNKDSKLRKSVTSNKERQSNELRSQTKDSTDLEKLENPQKSSSKTEEEVDKPWISYLRNLRIPMMCQLHRKITYSISESSLKSTPPQSKMKRDKSPVGLKKRNLNRNPNCNHNSKILSVNN